MNHWTKLSIEFANQRNYLDELFSIYPTIPEGIRDIDANLWQQVEQSFEAKNNIELFNILLKMDLFPIKDSYTAYLREDNSAIQRNPNTVNRLCGRLYEMGLDKIFERCSEPKETNRQLGPHFKNWINKGGLGIMPVKLDDFLKTAENAVLNDSDQGMKIFAQEKLGYKLDKGLDFVARFNGKYIIGETKFLTSSGGNQNNQFKSAVSLLNANASAIKVAIIDGVLYIPRSKKDSVMNINTEKNIMSVLLLREFLYSL